MSRVVRAADAYREERWLPLPVPPPPPSIEDHQQEVDDLLRAAQAQAQEVVQAAEAEATALRQQAYADGLAAGRAAGEQEFHERFAEVKALVDQVNWEREEYYTRAESEVVRLAITIAEQILGQQLALAPEIIVDMVRRHMLRIRERDVLLVRVHPDDFSTVSAARDEILAAVDGVQELTFAEDRRVDPGGVVIEAESGSIDARISSQLSMVKRALTEHAEVESESSPV